MEQKNSIVTVESGKFFLLSLSLHFRLQPILQRIKNNPKTVVMPIVEWIDRKHFGYMSGPQHYTFKVGGFTWSGFFIFADISEREQKRRKVPTEPAR